MPQRRHVIRRAVLLLVLIVVGGYLAMHGRSAWKEMQLRITMRQLQQRSMAIVRSPAHVVYDDDPANFEELVARKDGNFVGRLRMNPYRPAVLCSVKVYQEYMHLTGGYPVPIFLHGRAAGNGPQAMIDVEMGTRIDSADGVDAIVCAFSQAPMTILYVPDMNRSWYRLRMLGDAKTPLRVYAGQHDPNDPKAFTIRFRIGKEVGMIAGSLQPDGQVALILQSGPGKLEAISEVEAHQVSKSAVK